MDTSVFKNGFTFLWDGNLYTVLEFMRVPKYRGGSFVQTKLYNLDNQFHHLTPNQYLLGYPSISLHQYLPRQSLSP